MAPSPIDPGHTYSKTNHITFNFYKQQTSPAPIGYEYFLSVPPAYNSSAEKKWPLLLFLHGAGESQRGQNDSYATLRHGIPKIILAYDRLKDGAEPKIDIPPPARKGKPGRPSPEDLSSRPVPPEVCTLIAEGFITLSPSLNMSNGYGWNAKVLSALLDEVVKEYRVNLGDIHVTGFSMGGFGTWNVGMETPERFASLMPICGGGDAARAKLIKDVPQWIHHGELDDIVPISQSIQMQKALHKAGALDLTFTRYPDAAHDSWTFAYGNVEVFQWMLCKQKLGGEHEKTVVPEENKVDVSNA